MKLVTVVGARPQFIKAAVVSRAITKFNCSRPSVAEMIEELIIHTGQHYDDNMSRVFFEEMAIPEPTYNLGIGGGTHGAMTGRMLEKIESVLISEKPNMVMVYGDTNSTLAGALAAVKLLIPVTHVEAGLRSHNMNMPEEINRILTDHVSSLLFCPTQQAAVNLWKENIGAANNKHSVIIENVGDVMYDAILLYKHKARPSERTIKMIENLNSNYCLATIHRAENTDDTGRLLTIMRAFDYISEHRPVILPLHPRTRRILKEHSFEASNTIIIEPVSYNDILYLLNHCSVVFTDSGGLQKEAYFFEKPCVILREQTEWTELVEHGFSILAEANFNKIIEAEARAVVTQHDYSRKLYGQGNAGEKIVEVIYNWYTSIK